MKRCITTVVALVASSASAQNYIVHDGIADPYWHSLARINTQHAIVGGGGGVEQANYSLALNFPVKPPSVYGYYADLNNRGDIVGHRDFTMWNPPAGASQAIAVLDNQIVEIQPRGNQSAAYGINEGRVVLGRGGATGGSWIWNAGTNQFRTVVAPGNATPDSATNINDASQVTGLSGKRGFLWDPVAGSTWITRPQGVNDDLVPGRMNALGMLPLSGTATGNAAGDGVSGIVMPGGSFVNFSLLTGGRTSVAQLTDAGVAIGDSSALGPFIWDQQNGVRALKNLIPPLQLDGNITHGFLVNSAISISDDGWILARGTNVTQGPFFDHSYPIWMTLEPVPAPGSLLLCVVCSLGAWRRRPAEACL